MKAIKIIKLIVFVIVSLAMGYAVNAVLEKIPEYIMLIMAVYVPMYMWFVYSLLR